MRSLIQFANSYKLYEVPYLFSYQHILLLTIVVVYAVLLISLLKKRSDRFRTNVFTAILIVCVFIFAGRMFFGYENSRITTPNGNYRSLVPLELCNLNIFLLLIVVRSKNKTVRNFGFYIVMLAALIPLLVFPEIHMQSIDENGIRVGNTLLHYMFFDYYIIHTQLFVIPIVMLATKMIVPRYKEILKVLGLMLIVYGFIAGATAVLRNFKGFENANYMYTNHSSNLPILKSLEKLIPYPYLYELPIAVGLIPVFALMQFLYQLTTNIRVIFSKNKKCSNWKILFTDYQIKNEMRSIND